MLPDAKMTVDVNVRLRDFDGSEIVMKDPLGVELPEDQQFTLGRVLLNLIASAEVPGEPKNIILMQRVGAAIADAMEGTGEYIAGSIALGFLRGAAKYNGGPRPPAGRGPLYGVLMLAQVWEAIGDGSPEPKEAAAVEEGANP